MDPAPLNHSSYVDLSPLDYRVATTERGALGLRGWGPVPFLIGTHGVPYANPWSNTDDVVVLWARADLTVSGMEMALEKLPHLTWIHTDTAGVDHLPLDVIRDRKITVTKTSAYTKPVAEVALTSLLVGLKRVTDYHRKQRAADWFPGGTVPAGMLDGADVAILGKGEIGLQLGGMLRALGAGVRLLGSGTAPENVDTASHLVVACPLTPRTFGMVNLQLLNRLRPGGVVVNVSRGGVVSEDDMLKALDSQQVGFYASDVWSKEPLPDKSPFWRRDDVQVLPHVGWRARGTSSRQVEDFCQKVDAYVAGGTDGLWRRVNWIKGY